MLPARAIFRIGVDMEAEAAPKPLTLVKGPLCGGLGVIERRTSVSSVSSGPSLRRFVVPSSASEVGRLAEPVGVALSIVTENFLRRIRSRLADAEPYRHYPLKSSTSRG